MYFFHRNAVLQPDHISKTTSAAKTRNAQILKDQLWIGRNFNKGAKHPGKIFYFGWTAYTVNVWSLQWHATNMSSSDTLLTWKSSSLAVSSKLVSGLSCARNLSRYKLLYSGLCFNTKSLMAEAPRKFLYYCCFCENETAGFAQHIR